MENIYAALLLHKAGQEVNEENLKKVMTAAGANVDESQMKSLVTSLKDVDIDKELESANLVTSSTSSSGAESSKEASSEESEKKEEKSEAAAEGLSALFG